ncbi:hypothetical protein F3J44_22705 [Pantoea sp. Tr-811]|uniref:hypothetical protein n=1 Tax=Pantoea sp. Tr-811 TaxID=2608361 RepID=UPI00141DF777|nr:hypothetical protein [Pantoea sp. Tr-811]NIF29176.1 hypothetical protein [Pantoea sp. Tr-811]
MTDSENRILTPLDDEWEAEFDPTYDDKTSEGGVWYGKTDDEIVLIQIEEFKWDEHEQNHRRLDELEGEDE